MADRLVNIVLATSLTSPNFTMFQIHADAWGCPVLPPYGQYSMASQVIIVVPRPSLGFGQIYLFSVFMCKHYYYIY